MLNRESSQSDEPLAFFSGPLGDTETLYSIGSRYHLLSGGRNQRQTASEILGHRRTACLHDLPAGLARLQRASAGLVMATEATLRQRTSLAAHWALGSAAWRSSVLKVCAAPAHRELRPEARGLSWTLMPRDRELRLCADCCEFDERTTGVAFWRNEHQLPGVWVCMKHRAALGSRRLNYHSSEWLRPDLDRVTNWCDTKVAQPGGALFSIAEVMAWFCSRDSLSAGGLAAMVRTRLAESGWIRSEVSASADSFDRFHEQAILPLRTSVALPHFERLTTARWIREVLVDRRASHPLKWAILLAVTGPCSSTVLNDAYREEAARIPERRILQSSAPRRSRAPAKVYEALIAHRLLADACSNFGLSTADVERWLRRDRELAQAWRASKAERRRTEARAAVLAFREARPAAPRSQYIRECKHVRWLQLHDLEWVNSVLPARVSKLDKQSRLEF